MVVRAESLKYTARKNDQSNVLLTEIIFLDCHCKLRKFFVYHVMMYSKFFFSYCNILIAFSLLVSRFSRNLKTPAPAKLETKNTRMLFISVLISLRTDGKKNDSVY